MSPGELLEHLYGDEDREANALEAVVARLRRKLGGGILGTRRGFGYFLEGTASRRRQPPRALPGSSRAVEVIPDRGDGFAFCPTHRRPVRLPCTGPAGRTDQPEPA